MNPRGISIGGLSGAVVLIGTGLAAMKLATTAWTNLASTVVFALLLTAVVGALLGRGPERAYWIGFAIFGWAYLLFANGSGLGGQFGHDLTSGLDELAERIIPDEPPTPLADPGLAMEWKASRAVKLGNFVQIGRLFLALIFALAGGLVATAFALRTQSIERRAPVPTEPRDPS
jgi:hypothetical protein